MMPNTIPLPNSEDSPSIDSSTIAAELPMNHATSAAEMKSGLDGIEFGNELSGKRGTDLEADQHFRCPGTDWNVQVCAGDLQFSSVLHVPSLPGKIKRTRS